MSESKVAPIKGRYETVQAMAAHIMGDPKARSGIFFYFDTDGLMHRAEMGLTDADLGKILIKFLQLAQEGT